MQFEQHSMLAIYKWWKLLYFRPINPINSLQCRVVYKLDSTVKGCSLEKVACRLAVMRSSVMCDWIKWQAGYWFPMTTVLTSSWQLIDASEVAVYQHDVKMTWMSFCVCCFSISLAMNSQFTRNGLNGNTVSTLGAIAVTFSIGPYSNLLQIVAQRGPWSKVARNIFKVERESLAALIKLQTVRFIRFLLYFNSQFKDNEECWYSRQIVLLLNFEVFPCNSGSFRFERLHAFMSHE